jgi:hypothetical protein
MAKPKTIRLDATGPVARMYGHCLDAEAFRKEMQGALAACVESPEHRRAMEAIRARKPRVRRAI